MTELFQSKGQPVISVDAKKRELIGDFKNAGKEWRQKREPEKVRMYDFKDKELGHGIPYGVYDITANKGWVSVGIDGNTSEFACEAIRQWWNKIEHRMFCHITQNWRGKPLVSHEAMVSLIGGTTTKKGLKIEALLDRNEYKTGIKISDEELADLNLMRDDFHGEWNYSIHPRKIN